MEGTTAKHWQMHTGFDDMVGFTMLSDDAKQWLDENVETEGWQWLGNILWVDMRSAQQLINALMDTFD
jgi:hypothetical protein